MSGHTPGPWVTGNDFENSGGGFNVGAGHNVRSASTPRVCVAHTARVFFGGEEYVSEDQAQANARLIAAAPDLLEAARGVQTLYAELNAAMPAIINTPGGEAVIAAVQRANAAIARAEGRT